MAALTLDRMGEDMSEMQFFHGYFEKSNADVDIEDTDDFYDLEEKHGCYYVKVDGDLYKFWPSDIDVDAYGFSVAVKPSGVPQLMLYWYNGGAGVHEVAEDAIRQYLKDAPQ